MSIRLTGRAVRERVASHVHPDVRFVLEALAEYQNVLFQQQTEMATLVDTMSDIINNFVGVAEQMKKATESHQKYQDHDDDKLLIGD